MHRCFLNVTTLSLVILGGASHAAVQWYGTGHYYEAVLSTGNWASANAAAQAAGGYLATITSPEENAFVYSLISGNNDFWFMDPMNGIGPWLGGFQPEGSPEPGGNWQWVTGESFAYSNWAGGEPNDGVGQYEEDRMHFFGPHTLMSPQWNDAPQGEARIKGYIVEWDANPIPDPGSGGLFVSPHFTDAVLRFNETTGSLISVFASGVELDYPAGVLFGPDGNLYVSSYLNDQILRYDGDTGAFLDVFVPPGSGCLDGPVGIIFGPDGHLYVCSSSTDTILRYNGTTGVFIDTFATDAADPMALVFGPDWDLYVSSPGENCVKRYEGTTGASKGIFASGGGLNQPTGLVFGPDGNLYVSSHLSHQVLRFHGTTGAFIDVFASGGGLYSPWGLLFGPYGYFYVASSGTDNVLRYEGTTGAYLDTFVPSGSGGMDYPSLMTFRKTNPTTLAYDDGNIPPVALDDEYPSIENPVEVDEDTVLTVDPPGILGNDTDEDEDSLTVTEVNGDPGNVGPLISLPSGALLTVSSLGDFSYDPNGQFDDLASGSPPAIDTFKYKAHDGKEASNEATVTIYIGGVNDPPVAVDDDNYSTDEDTPLEVPAPGVLGNDKDPDGTPQVVSYTQPTNGSVMLSPNGSFTYTPTPNFHGEDTFTYTIEDDHQASATATVTITVNPGNDAPVANSQAVETERDTAKAITLTATDVDGDPLTYRIDTGPSHGALSGTLPNVTYTPALNYTGPDSFTFLANDGQEDSNVATVSIVVSNTVTVTLKDHNGVGIAGGIVKWADGSWHDAGITGPDGRLTFTISNPNYSKIKMTCHQGSVEKDRAALVASNYTWQTVVATIRLIDHTGSGIAGGAVAQGGGFWDTTPGLTDAEGNVYWEVFPGSYKFRMSYHSASQEITQNIATPVIFQTGAVHSNSGTATHYAQGSWQPFVQDIELLPHPTAWKFKFNDGTATTYYPIVAGVVNPIH